MTTNSNRRYTPEPPDLRVLPLINAPSEVVQWLEHYWEKLELPREEAQRLAVTDDRMEFHRWTGKRLNPLALGCYCYLPHAGSSSVPTVDSANLTAPVYAPPRVQPSLPGFGLASAADGTGAARETAADYRHLIFVEPGLLPLGIEVTVAHELIHLADRVKGNPRKHRCHGYDSISVDEAAVT
ncbi:MAG: hypothetical protein ACHQ4H_12710, partial [Ktedonobacterales bacterium]